MVEGLRVENVEPQPLNILNPQHSKPLNNSIIHTDN